MASILAFAVGACASSDNGTHALADGGTGGFTAGGIDGGSSAADGGSRSEAISSLGKVDLLFVIDNSISMADKTAVLQAAIPDLRTWLTDEANGIADLHVGVVTSSLGSFGSDICDRTDEGDDQAHLLGTRTRAAALGLSDGFIAWDRTKSINELEMQLQSLVALAGEQGCGFESTLEAAYRFLSDPSPHREILVAPCTGDTSNSCATPTGRDESLLAQRAAFLRPDSLVALFLLTDENDCSMRPEG
jgi:hypothetical protein